MHHVELTLRLAHMVYIQFYMIHKPCEIEYDILAINFCVYIRFNMTTISRIFDYTWVNQKYRYLILAVTVPML